MRILSLGAGVQSTTLALMAAKGELGAIPDAAIFADTGWEPRAVYDHLERLTQALPYPVIKVSAGNILDEIKTRNSQRSGRFASVPWFIRNPDGRPGMGRRQCTAHYKLEPIKREVVRLLGGKRPKGGAEMWIGISTDEAIRMKPSRVQYIVNRWPLIERRMSRSDCIRWLEAAGWSAPKSSCLGCPFHSDAQWREIKAGPADEWASVVEADKAIRDNSHRGMRGQQYMHRSLRPIDEIDLRTDAELGQADLFGNDCEGMCGV